MKEFFCKFQSLPLPKKLCWGGVALLPVYLIVPIMSLAGNASSKFIPASRLVSKSLLDKVIQENYLNTAVKLDRQQLKVLQIQGSNLHKLYFFDFNNSQLCGIAGCLYVAYIQEGTQVLNLYLQPNLPKGRELFAVDRQKYSDGFPCLNLTQVLDDNTLSVTQYCYLKSSQAFVQFNQQSVSILGEKNLPTTENNKPSPSSKSQDKKFENHFESKSKSSQSQNSVNSKFNPSTTTK
jgi:hypothetical protein